MYKKNKNKNMKYLKKFEGFSSRIVENAEAADLDAIEKAVLAATSALITDPKVLPLVKAEEVSDSQEAQNQIQSKPEVQAKPEVALKEELMHELAFENSTSFEFFLKIILPALLFLIGTPIAIFAKKATKERKKFIMDYLTKDNYKNLKAVLTKNPETKSKLDSLGEAAFKDVSFIKAAMKEASEMLKSDTKFMRYMNSKV